MNRMKTLLVVILAAVLLTFSVSGTIAWLSVKTEKVENTFTPAKVDTEIEEKFENNVKSVIKVENTGTIPVYVRVSVSGYWCDSTGIIKPWEGSVTLAENSNWFKGSDGFYYYNKSIAPNGRTENLLGKSIEASVQADGSYLVINVLHQSIQYAPVSVVNDKWPAVTATLSTDGTSGTLSANR